MLRLTVQVQTKKIKLCEYVCGVADLCSLFMLLMKMQFLLLYNCLYNLMQIKDYCDFPCF